MESASPASRRKESPSRLLDAKVALITGGNRGIGLAIARAFSEAGARLVLVARSEPELKGAQVELRDGTAACEVFAGDVSREKDVERVVSAALKAFGRVDILVNNAGVYGPIGPVTQVDSSKWLEAIQVNLFGTFLMTRAVLPAMIRARAGKIINFSGGGALNAFPRFSAYGASKAAVVRFTETVAEEVKEYGIDVNAIAPGPVNTRLLDQALAAGEEAVGREFYAKALKQKQDGGTPPEKAADLAVFLASSRSDGLTGRVLSALWDDWRKFADLKSEIMATDIYTMRRITAKDRGKSW